MSDAQQHGHHIARMLGTLLTMMLVLAGAALIGCSGEELSDGSINTADAGGDWSAADAMLVACQEGAVKTAADGCNTCTCVSGDWACTDAPCICPAAAVGDGVDCAAVVTWARDPDSQTCCQYGSACEAPPEWPQYFSRTGCEVGCNPGDEMLLDDGCNTCQCLDDGTWACTEIECTPAAPGCATDEDCVVSGCSGQVCSVEVVSTTCEFRPEYACYADAITSCGCNNGTCGWAQTPELQSCLGQAARCTPGEVKIDDDGCNTCFCSDTGDWACTDRACVDVCPPARPPEPGEGCDDAFVWARDPLTGLCCEYTDSCGPSEGWETFGDPQSCTSFDVCEPGVTQTAPDGCNTCTCQEDGSWLCTEIACARVCETHDDCIVTGCSGQVCASEHVFTTCESRPEYACYASDITSCMCNNGVCGWEQTQYLTQCLADTTPVP